MKNLKEIAITAALLMAAVCVSAQHEKSAGINLSLWKTACTQPLDTMQTTWLNIGLMSAMNNLDGIGINILGSMVHGNVNGVQLTGLSNLAVGSMRGVQIAGVSNVSGNHTTGVSIAGLVNITGNDCSGATIAGLVAIGGNNQSGLMMSGLMNVTDNKASGLQLAGISNITSENYNGVMVSGLLNIAGGNTDGIQLSGLANITGKSLNGLQFGLCNYATKARGLQIGLVNYYREEMKGFQLGLVNANPDTRVQMLVYGGNVTPANIGVRFKNKLFYTLIGMGTMQKGLNDKFSLSASYRAGLSVDLVKRLSLSGDLGFQHIEALKNKDEHIPRRLYALQARVNLEYQLTKKFGIFATGGYGLTRRYNRSGNYDKGAIVEAGIVLF
jgi:hypothetical protein